MRKTTKGYKAHFRGYDLVIPAGAETTHMTAVGPDPKYNFLSGGCLRETARKATGFDNSGLLHDLVFYGLNIPEEYFEGESK